jgi:MFS transporter, PAT family, solute carrier family 33 (acetyl-CoA transportor), member 1
LLSAVAAGRWAAAGSPFAPWQRAYLLRTLAAILSTLTVLFFPSNASSLSAHPVAFGVLTAISLLTSFSSTLMFTSMGTFFNRISDPDMGGAYLTMLNTILNIGITVPQVGMFALVDALSLNVCEYVCPCPPFLSIPMIELLLQPL